MTALLGSSSLTASSEVSRTIDIYLIRHAETWNNSGDPTRNIIANQIIQGGNADEDRHKLSDEGENNAINLGKVLKERFPDLPRIYTANLKRSIQTAKLATKEFGFKIKFLDNSDEEIAEPEEGIIKKEDLAEIRHGRNDGKTSVKVRNELYKAMFDREREKHSMEEPDYDPYWKWKIVPSENGVGGSFDDAETSWNLLTRVVNTLIEIGDDHLKDNHLGDKVAAITSSAVILTLKINSAWRKKVKNDEPFEELPIFCEQGLTKNAGFYHFRYHPEEKDFLDKIEFIED